MEQITLTRLSARDILERARTYLGDGALTGTWAAHGPFCVSCAIAKAKGDLERELDEAAPLTWNDAPLEWAAMLLRTTQPDADQSTAIAAIDWALTRVD